MKISKYNSIIKIGCKNLLYNSLSDCFALAENTIINAIRNKDIHSIENSVSSTISTLKQGGFIIDDETNEQNILENLIKKIDYNENEFILTVNPTMNCNLKCWYCYENHQGNMYISSTIVQYIQKFITKKVLETHGIKRFYLGFFGGEPFLCFNSVIMPLITHYIKVCKTKNIPPYISFTTNGTLLNKEKIDKLIESTNNLSFQITLDGCKEDHDSIRNLPNQSSYDVILRNINLLINKKCYVTLRINYTHKNISNLSSIINDLSSMPYEYRKYLYLDFQQIWQDASKYNLKDKINIVYEYAIKNKINISSNNFDRVRKSCYADKKNQAIINYNGDVFKCTARDFLHEKRYGYLNELGEIIWDTPLLTQRMQSKFSNTSCQACRIAPLCSGNCSQVRIEKNNNNYCILNYDENKKDSIILSRFENKYKI